MRIDNVTDTENPDLLNTLSDIFFTNKAGANQDEERLFMMSSDTNSRKVIMADQVSDTEFGVVKVNNVPVEVDLVTRKWEGLTFTPGGFIMFAVADEINNDDSSRWRFRIYRSFPSLTPAAAPDLDAASDTGSSNTNNITQDTTPTFSGTLTRAIFEDSVPVKDAWVWLYADDGTGPVQTGSPDQVDGDGKYSVTAGVLDDDTYDFTIRASETDTFDDDFFSFDSSALSVQIAYADLTDNGYVDFADLTVLLANWGKTDPFPSLAEGNLVDAPNTTIDFADLTVLLAAWNPPPAEALVATQEPGGSTLGRLQAAAADLVLAGDPNDWSRIRSLFSDLIGG